jgi:hypothetical protein
LGLPTFGNVARVDAQHWVAKARVGIGKGVHCRNGLQVYVGEEHVRTHGLSPHKHSLAVCIELAGKQVGVGIN